MCLFEWQTFQLLTARWLHTQYAGTEYPALWIVLKLFRFFFFSHSLSDHAVEKVSRNHCSTKSFFFSVYSFSFVCSFGSSTLVIILFRVTIHLLCTCAIICLIISSVSVIATQTCSFSLWFMWYSCVHHVCGSSHLVMPEAPLVGMNIIICPV